MKKILFVDDNDIAIKLFNCMISNDVKYEFHIINNPKKVDLNYEYDLAILDYDMSIMNGIELGKKILEKYPNTKLVLSTAFSIDEIKEDYSMFDKLVRKPWNFDDFEELIIS